MLVSLKLSKSKKLEYEHIFKTEWAELFFGYVSLAFMAILLSPLLIAGGRWKKD